MDRYDVTEMGLISLITVTNSKVFNYWAMLTTEAVDKPKPPLGCILHLCDRLLRKKGNSIGIEKIFPYSPYYPFNNSNFGAHLHSKSGNYGSDHRGEHSVLSELSKCMKVQKWALKYHHNNLEIKFH